MAGEEVVDGRLRRYYRLTTHGKAIESPPATRREAWLYFQSLGSFTTLTPATHRVKFTAASISSIAMAGVLLVGLMALWIGDLCRGSKLRDTTS